MYIVNEVDNHETNITIIKGDTFKELIRISDDARLTYVPEAADKIMFAVYNKYTDETPLFEKEIPYDTMVLQLSYKETSKMKYGKYVYKVKLIRKNCETDTFLHGQFNVQGVI